MTSKAVYHWPVLCVACALAFTSACSAGDGRPRLFDPLRIALFGPNAIEQRVALYGPAARARLIPWFEAAGVEYPPHAAVLAGFKRERELQLYAIDDDETPRFVRTYPILGASGVLGPKLAEGDLQVPEGLYRIELLNPWSHYHLSLRLDYPNEFDRARAAEEGRTNLGGDIMIHGGKGSVGCLAMGDEAVEELFVLVSDVGKRNVTVVLSPLDFRSAIPPPGLDTSYRWTPELYAEIRAAVQKLPQAQTQSLDGTESY